MRIYTKVSLKWDGSTYTIDEASSLWYDYNGEVSLCCGATQDQKDILASQKSLMGTITGQLSTVFGNSGTVFNDLMAAYAPTALAGPNQQGFSPSELATLKSQAITETGQAYQHAKEAVGERMAAFGGGNTYLPSGAQVGANIALANAGASQTANELNQINLQNWETGRQNWLAASRGLAGATSVYDPAIGFANAAVNSGNAAANTANQIAQENNSWVNGLMGIAGSLGGAAMGAFTGGMGGAASGATAAFPGMSPGQISQSFGGPSSAGTIDMSGSY